MISAPAAAGLRRNCHDGTNTSSSTTAVPEHDLGRVPNHWGFYRPELQVLDGTAVEVARTAVKRWKDSPRRDQGCRHPWSLRVRLRKLGYDFLRSMGERH